MKEGCCCHLSDDNDGSVALDLATKRPLWQNRHVEQQFDYTGKVAGLPNKVKFDSYLFDIGVIKTEGLQSLAMQAGGGGWEMFPLQNILNLGALMH